MPSELAHRIDTGGSHPVLELTGTLDAALFRSALLGALADQPEGLIVDVTGLTVGDDGPGVLAEVSGLNSTWPCTRIAICDSRGAGSWRTAGVAVVADRDAAIAALGAAKPADRVRQDLEPIVGAARRAREMVTAACSEWGVPQVSGHGCIVVTEMVNNVVAHSQTPMTVLLGRHDGAVSIAVRDQSSALPRYSGGPPAPTSYGGRGLLLIDSVARRWGHLALPGGKVVWAVLGDDPEP